MVQALRLLAARQPVLRVAVHEDPAGRLVFHEYTDALDRQRVDIDLDGQTDIDRALTDRVNEPPCPVITDHALPWRVRIVSLSSGCRVELCTSHLVVDGNGLPRLLLLWLKTAEELHRRLGADPDPEAVDGLCREQWQTELHAPPEVVLATQAAYRESLQWQHRFTPLIPRVFFGFARDALRYKGHAPFREAVPMESRRDAVLSLVLAPDAVQTLLAAARAHDVTLHALLLGCAMAAQQKAFALQPGQTYSFGSPVSLRNRVEPPIDMATLGTWVSDVEHHITIEADGDPLRYARAVAADLQGLPESAFHTQHDVPGRLRLVSSSLVREIFLNDMDDCGRIGSGLSNLGRLDEATSYALGEEVSVARQGWTQSQAAFGPDFFLGVTTLGGVMTINLTYTEPLHSTEDAHRYLVAIRECLDAVSSRQP